MSACDAGKPERSTQLYRSVNYLPGAPLSDDDRVLSAKGRARRDQIIEVAGRLFGQRGYAAVSWRDIAAEVGITHPLLAHYFAGKDELLFAVMDSWRQRAERHRLIADDDPEGIPDRIVALAEENERTPGYIALFSGLAADGIDPDHPTHDRFIEQHDTVYALLLSFFNWAEQKGRLRSGVDPRIAARSLMALEDGAQVQWLYRPEAVDVPAIVRSYLNLVLEPKA